ncbi:hypothetical protein Val02_49040 [Virgisporangium aliadipatigenens]|uniref:Uncharacterized protein n=1 Tax=Virgisporangium aliadipatigenens TaxID=741659 RepID=A0A8J3YPN6_9ACTN|nr:hypothetical protein [Virgisporangium aliadipatigenens]GIJ48018.1 hypothetical protein Val02_49040 [Virgisporangium aliadipatigenens]
MAYSGWGCLPAVMFAAVVGLWFKLVDDGGGDWARASLISAFVVLVLGGVNLLFAMGLNRAETPRGHVWTGRHAANGTSLQGHTPAFLGLAAALFAGWTVQWVPWPVAVVAYLLLTALYYAVPTGLRTIEKNRIVARRQRFAAERDLSIRKELPSLTTRWTLDPPRAAPFESLAASMNAPAKPTLREAFAVVSGVHEEDRFTIADAYVAVPHAPAKAWQQRRITICAVHLEVALPHIRLSVRRDGDGVEVGVDTAVPQLAQALVTADVVNAMVDSGLLSWEIQGRDALVFLEQAGDHQDPDAEALDTVELLGIVTSWLPEELATWGGGSLPDLPSSFEPA